MARINIEDKLLSDPRFILASAEIGDREATIGIAYSFFRIAQSYWFPKKELIPEKLFKLMRGADVWIKFGLAEERDGSFYICGSEGQFEWLFQKSQAGTKGSHTRWNKPTIGVTGTDNAVIQRYNAVNQRHNAVIHPNDGCYTDVNHPNGVRMTSSSSSSSYSNSLKEEEEYICSEQKKSFVTEPIPELASPDYVNLLSKIKTIIQEKWLKLYPDVDWIKSELLKAEIWLGENGHKAPKKNFGQFMTNWLSRGWEQHRRTLTPKQKSASEDFLEHMKKKGYQ